MFQTKFVEKSKIYFIFHNRFPKIVPFMRFCWKKYGRAGEVADGNVIVRMRFPCWITTATNADSEYIILVTFLLQQWLRERILCDVIRTLFFLPPGLPPSNFIRTSLQFLITSHAVYVVATFPCCYHRVQWSDSISTSFCQATGAFWERASRSAVMKCIISSLIYVSTTIIYWII